MLHRAQVDLGWCHYTPRTVEDAAESSIRKLDLHARVAIERVRGTMVKSVIDSVTRQVRSYSWLEHA